MPPENLASSSSAEQPIAVPLALQSKPGIPRRTQEEDRAAEEAPLYSFAVEHAKFRDYYRNTTLRPMLERYGEEMETVIKLAARSADVAPTGSPAGANPTPAIKAEALRLDFDAVGMAAYDERYTYVDKRDWVRFGSVVCLAMEQEYDVTQLAPSVETELAVWDNYARISWMGLDLAEFIRSRGYRAQVHIATDPSCVILPYFVEAGLGQLGANGQLLSPRFGSRARLMVLTTDAPLVFDRPVDFGVNRLCEECQICVRRCPGRALRHEKRWWRGVHEFKVDLARCMPMLQRYDACAVCMKVCPVQKYGLDSVLDHYEKSGGEILGKGSDDLEGYDLPDKGHLRPGRLPRFSKEDFAIPGGRADPAVAGPVIPGI